MLTYFRTIQYNSNFIYVQCPHFLVIFPENKNIFSSNYYFSFDKSPIDPNWSGSGEKKGVKK
jgi:hypothetical protein